jgi:hypothetical protein
MPEPQRLPATDDPPLSRAEFDHYRDQLVELHRVRERDLPQLLRDARGFVANDTAEEIAQTREDEAVVEARIASRFGLPNGTIEEISIVAVGPPLPQAEAA